jgi:RNA polymerase-binding transcription factor DksA
MATKKKSVSKTKTVAKKKPATKKVATKVNNTAEKSSSSKKTAVKPVAKKTEAKATKASTPKVSKKAPAAKKAPAKTDAPVEEVTEAEVVAVKRGRKKRANAYFTAKELRDFKRRLLNLRDSVVDGISFLTGDNLSGNQAERTGEEGTDNFNRESAMKHVSSEQDIIYEIDEALGRIANGTYGICEHSSEPIEKERLKVMPHARHSVKVQSDLEKGRSRYRPFGPSLVRP